ncbi:hypothetical protein GOP47_0028430 [Adiantum capillus-veneris]|nr:hypothetical protein GOP47_0028430 [Adiantum capillus-veneris]
MEFLHFVLVRDPSKRPTLDAVISQLEQLKTRLRTDDNNQSMADGGSLSQDVNRIILYDATFKNSDFKEDNLVLVRHATSERLYTDCEGHRVSILNLLAGGNTFREKVAGKHASRTIPSRRVCACKTFKLKDQKQK